MEYVEQGQGHQRRTGSRKFVGVRITAARPGWLNSAGPTADGASRLHRLNGGIERHFTYDEGFGGKLGPGWSLQGVATILNASYRGRMRSTSERPPTCQSLRTPT